MGVSTTSKLKIGLLAAAVCTTALFADAGVASADVISCTDGSSDGNVRTCITVIGTGLHVDEMIATACVVDSARTLQVCIHPDPNPDQAICSSFDTVGVGGCLNVTWTPGVDVTGGDYCTRTWRQNNDGSSPTLIGQPCVDVHQ